MSHKAHYNTIITVINYHTTILYYCIIPSEQALQCSGICARRVQLPITMLSFNNIGVKLFCITI